MDPANRISVSVGLGGLTQASGETGGPDTPSLVHRSQTLALCYALQSVLLFDSTSVEAANQQVKTLADAFILEQPGNLGSAAYLEFLFPVRLSGLAGNDNKPFFNPKIVVIKKTLTQALEAAGVDQRFLRFGLTVVD